MVHSVFGQLLYTEVSLSCFNPTRISTASCVTAIGAATNATLRELNRGRNTLVPDEKPAETISEGTSPLAYQVQSQGAQLEVVESGPAYSHQEVYWAYS